MCVVCEYVHMCGCIFVFVYVVGVVSDVMLYEGMQINMASILCVVGGGKCVNDD